MLIDDLIEDGIDVMQLGKSLKGNSKYNYETVRTVFRRSFGSVHAALKSYGLFESNGIPNGLELERCCYITSDYKVMVNRYEKERIKDIYYLSDIEFIRLINPVKESLMQDALDCLLRDAFLDKALLPRVGDDNSMSKYIKNKYGGMFKMLDTIGLSILADSIVYQCSDCGDLVPISNFAQNKGKPYSIESKCKLCFYSSKNIDCMTVNRHKRRAKEKYLPCNLTKTEYTYNQCFLTNRDETSLEHALPISLGHGGTTRGNCYPMRLDLNISKNDKHLFLWFKANRQRFKLSQSKFDRLIEWLASANALSVQEYREFYDWCFANPRTVDEIKCDQRHSIEIWREASGKQFPLPAYTQTYYSTESEAVS